MVIALSGIPGSGKNVRATYLAKKHFRKQNNIVRKIIRKVKHVEINLLQEENNYLKKENKKCNGTSADFWKE